MTPSITILSAVTPNAPNIFPASKIPTRFTGKDDLQVGSEGFMKPSGSSRVEPEKALCLSRGYGRDRVRRFSSLMGGVGASCTLIRQDLTLPDQTGPDPTRPSSTRRDPTRPKPDPTRPDPTRPDPTRPDPTRPDPTRPDPTRPDPTLA